MDDNIWQGLATAVACRIEFERQCMRGPLVDESTVVRFAAEYLQARWEGPIEVGFPHPDMPGKFIDLIGKKRFSGQVNLMMEAKWVKEEGGVREWLKEIILDLFRLQHASTKVAQGTDRLLLAAGHRTKLNSELRERVVHSDGPSILAIPHVLPLTKASDGKLASFKMFEADTTIRRWVQTCRAKLGFDLPKRYEVALEGVYATSDGDDAIEVLVWRTRRIQNGTFFNPLTAWPKSSKKKKAAKA